VSEDGCSYRVVVLVVRSRLCHEGVVVVVVVVVVNGGGVMVVRLCDSVSGSVFE
jgi:hypothetical protein